MLNPIDLRLRQLVALWIDGTPSSLQSIPRLCHEIAGLAANGRYAGNLDQDLLRRAGRLSAKAERRLAACLRIQSRTGAYSMHGALELSPHLATTGWEG